MTGLRRGMCELMCPEIYNIAGPELHALFFPTFEIETIGIDPEASIPGVSGAHSAAIISTHEIRSKPSQITDMHGQTS